MTVAEIVQTFIVTPDCDGALIVDASAVARGPRDVTQWRLEHDDERPGNWAHWPSNQQSYPLGQLLLGIAHAYTIEDQQ